MDEFTYGVRTIQRTILQEKPIVSFLKDRYFPEIIESEKEEVNVEVSRRNTTLLPAVRRTDSAINSGAVAPHEVRTYVPGYLFYKTVVTISEANKRVMGEPTDNPYSPAQRIMQILAEKVDKGIRTSIANIEEAQCSQIIKTGKLITKGLTQEGAIYDMDEINFGTDSDLVGGALDTLWTTSSDIINSLRDICLAVYAKGYVMPTEIVVGKKVLETLLGNSKFMSVLDNRRIEGNMIRAQQFLGIPGVALNGVINIPMVGDLMILTYMNDYRYNTSGSVTPMIDENGLLVTSQGWGAMAYAGLYDKTGSVPNIVAGRTLVHAMEGTPENHFAYSAYVQSAPMGMPAQLDRWFYKTVVAA